jgi:hypothetical protein
VDTRTDQTSLIELRHDFPGHRIWRALRWDGLPGDWVATLRDPAAGVDPTVVADGPDELRAALRTERARATERRQ